MFAAGLKKIATRFDDELKFFKGWINKPRAVGSIIPTSNGTAKQMASVIDTTSDLPVLEVGPGTGVVTRAILANGVLPENLYAIEYFHDFVLHLQKNFSGINIIEGDAFDLDRTLENMDHLIFDSIISSVPLLNFPMSMRIQYIENLVQRLAPGRPLVQLTYSPFMLSPVTLGAGNYTAEHFHFTMRNLPPAHLWIYRKAKEN